MAERFLRQDISAAAMWSEDDMLERTRSLEGEIFREVAGRRTLRVKIAGRFYFAKLHEGVGWGEIFKNWLYLKRPVYGARNEYEACRYLERVGITAPRVAAFAEAEGPARNRFSFVLCDELAGYQDLETLTADWITTPPEPMVKRRLLIQVAQFARRFHASGLAHRDFYLCHLLRNSADVSAPLGVLDLHRALKFDSLPVRWRQKDLAALLFSSLDLPVSRLSWLRFVRVYTARPLKETFARDRTFWVGVYTRACKLYEKGRRKGLVTGAFQP